MIYGRLNSLPFFICDFLVVNAYSENARSATLIGLLGAWIAQRAISGLLFGISATDPITLAGAASVLIAVAVLASGIPGVQAMIIDPLRALHED
jgi:hypothetical protein